MVVMEEVAVVAVVVVEAVSNLFRLNTNNVRVKDDSLTLIDEIRVMPLQYCS